MGNNQLRAWDIHIYGSFGVAMIGIRMVGLMGKKMRDTVAGGCKHRDCGTRWGTIQDVGGSFWWDSFRPLFILDISPLPGKITGPGVPDGNYGLLTTRSGHQDLHTLDSSEHVSLSKWSARWTTHATTCGQTTHTSICPPRPWPPRTKRQVHISRCRNSKTPACNPPQLLGVKKKPPPSPSTFRYPVC